MTNEEAKEIIAFCKNYELGHKFIEAFDLSIEALEKQIAKSPKRLNYEPLIDDGWVYKCPTCGCACGANRYYLNITQDDEYCTQCGQKLEIIWD